MSEAFGLTSCSYGFVPESELSHKPQAQYGLVPRLSHLEWQKPSPSGLKNLECSTRVGIIILHSPTTTHHLWFFRLARAGVFAS